MFQILLFPWPGPIHLQVLLFSISFVIYVLFRNGKNRLILGHRQIQISLYFPRKKMFCAFLPEGGRSSTFKVLFHKMLEGLSYPIQLFLFPMNQNQNVHLYDPYKL